ncbi:ribosome biogenesis protein WDR12 homolog [Macrobrachium rosenbergii]|uniref:ribosome biogenesis protein WDR12 homolog n=1 Tax=Macrobrachium rosenbergii TaxID=79674 RepID=UPI0034D55AC2
MAKNLKKLNESLHPNVLVKFVTKQEQYAVPGASVSIPSNTDTAGLNKILKTFLKKSGTDPGKDFPLFDFVVKGQILVGLLEKQLEEDDISLEKVIEIEYVKQQPPPTPKDSLQHDDWVSTLQCTDKWLLTGCYDNTVHLWDADGLHAGKGEKAHTLTIPAHKAPVKAVAWVHTDSPTKTFISASIDQTAVVWVWQSNTNTVECVSECRGHSQSVESVAVSPSCKRFATGSWDNMLKIWSLGKPSVLEEAAADDSEQEKKKIKGSAKKPEKKTPIMTLSGHTESVGSVVWMSNEEVITGSWDHSLRIWDLEIGGLRSQYNSNCAIFSVTFSPLNGTVLTGCADKYIRLYDPRVSDGSIVQQKYISHTKWVPSVKWSSVSEHLFVSGGYDNLVKMWDSRRPKAPVYDLTGHTDKVLAVDWSNSKFIVSGSADCTAKVYSSEKNV